MTGLRNLLTVVGVAVCLLAAGYERRSNADTGQTQTSPASQSRPTSQSRPSQLDLPADKPLAAYQNDLIDVAFGSAVMIPVDPHIYDRSRTQEAVVATCIKLDQPKRAMGYAARISDWRQGACYADLAFYCVKHGHREDAQKLIDLATPIAKAAGEDWQKDAIRVKIAKAQVLLGQAAQAQESETNLENSETGKVMAVRISQGDDDSFDAQMKALEPLLAAKQQIDIIRNGLESATQLFDRFYGDAGRRELVEKMIKDSWRPMPLPVRIDLLARLTEFALGHSDQAKAMELAGEAQDIFEGANWPLEYGMQLSARLADLRFRAGDKDKAKQDADAAAARYKSGRAGIVDINRAGAIRPLAQAYQAMGDTAGAMAVYRQAIEDGAENPNSRPRAMDLSATCCSMALCGFEPDADLWSRIRQIQQGLGKPQ